VDLELDNLYIEISRNSMGEILLTSLGQKAKKE
jgi:hypothetical protein